MRERSARSGKARFCRMSLAAAVLVTVLTGAAVEAQEVIDSTDLASPIDDFTTHTYSVGAGPIGSFADHTITRRFGAPIKEIHVTIVGGRADDIGFVGGLLVTNVVPQCSDVATVVAPVDVSSQVTVSGAEASLTLRAQENCCCVTGWGSATQGDRADARLHWEVTLGESEYAVEFNSFIEAPWVQGPVSTFCFTGHGRPHRLIFAGDGRGFGAGAASFRTRQLATLVTDENVDADGIVDGSVENLVGETKSFAPDALDDGVLDANDEDGVLHDCHLLDDRDTASNADMSVTSVRPVAGGSVLVRLKGGPGNPLARPNCDIDWDLQLQITDDGTTTTYQLTGAHDGFPAYELYVNGQAIYQYSPGSHGLTALCGGLDAHVQKTGTLE